MTLDEKKIRTKLKQKESNKKWRERNKKHIAAYKDINKKSISETQAKYYHNKKDNDPNFIKKRYEQTKLWKSTNKNKMNASRRCYEINRLKSDPLYKSTYIVRSCIHNALKRMGYKKNSKTSIILGCTYLEFKDHLESKFESWMSWDNYGLYNGELNYGWDVDHIIPVSSAINEDDVIALNHHTNLQPLCSHINRDIKKDKY